MEVSHFSHNHGLVFHQITQGSEIHCSGCKSPGSGNVYACWQCGYFLHEHCFRAERSLKHPSHPLHPLTLVPSPTYPLGSFFCNLCSLGGDGFSYSCSECEFDIHVHCAHMLNPNPHVAPSPVIAPNFTQNGIYPPPIQTSPFQTYPPPHNAAIAHNPLPQYTAYPHNQNNPIPTYPPPHNAAMPNNPQTFPPQPQNTSYPPTPNNPLPQDTANNTISAYSQPNGPPPQNSGAPVYPTPMPSAQPNQTVPNYSSGMHSNTTTNPPQTPVQNNNPQPPPTTIKHFSHPHVLKAMGIDQKNAKVCSACEREFSGSAYCCTESHCTFNLHKACFDAPREIRHKSHLQHPLTLVAAPPYSDGFTCNACLKEGKAFAYTCATCSYDLHIYCVRWPESVTRSDHKHPMKLYYSCEEALGLAPDEEAGFVCDVCNDPVDDMGWVYICRECDFGAHPECVNSEMKQQNGRSEEFDAFRFQLEEETRKAALELWD